MTNAGSAEVTVTLGLQRLAQDVAKANEQLKTQLRDVEVGIKVDADGKPIAQLGNQLDDLKTKGQGVGEVLTGALQRVGQQGVDAAINAFKSLAGEIQQIIGKSNKAATELDSAQAAIRTLGADSDDVTKSLSALSRELGYQASTTELVKSGYDTLSSKTETLVAGMSDAQVATEILRASTIGAIGGFSDTNTVADALTSTLNAYGASAAEATTYVDKFSAVQAAGKITIDQYAQQIGRVASIAAQAGVSIDELNGFIATATVSGVPVESTFAGMRQAIAAVLQPSDKAAEAAKKLKISFDAATLKTKGLSGILGELNAKGLDTQENLLNLFGSVEAVTAIAPSAGTGFKNLKTNIDASANSAGLGKKQFDEIANSMEGKAKAAANQLNESLTELGKTLAPLNLGFTNFTSNATGALAELIGKVADQTQAFEIIEEASKRFNEALARNPELVDKLAAALAKVGSIIAEVASQGIDAFIKFLESPSFEQGINNFVAIANVVGKFAGALITVGEVYHAAIEPIFSGISAVIGRISQAIDFVGDALGTAATKANEFGKSLSELPIVKQLLDAVKSARELVNQLGLVPQAVQKAETGLASTIQDAGAKTLQETREKANPKPKTKPQDPAPKPPATPKTETEKSDPIAALKAEYDRRNAVVENAYKQRQTIIQTALAQGSKTEAQAQTDLRTAENNYLTQRIANNQEQLGKLRELEKSTKDPKEAAKLGQQITAIESSIASDRLKISQNGAEQQKQLIKDREQAEKDAAENRKRIEQDALNSIEAANQQAATAIENSQNSRVAAVLQAQLKSGKGAEEAAREAADAIKAIELDSTNQTITEKQRELDEIRKLRQQGTVSAEEAAKRESQLITEIGSLNTTRLNKEIELQKAVRDEAVRAIEEQYAKIEEKVKTATGLIDLQKGALQQQSDLLGAQSNLQSSLNTLSQERLNTQIALAEASGNDNKVGELKNQQLKLQRQQLQESFKLQQQELELKQKDRELTLEQQKLQAQLNTLEAQSAIEQAKAEGASQDKIDRLNAMLGLRQQQEIAVEKQAGNVSRLNELERKNLETQKQISLEKQRQAEIAQKESQAKQQDQQNPNERTTTDPNSSGVVYRNYSTTGFQGSDYDGPADRDYSPDRDKPLRSEEDRKTYLDRQNEAYANFDPRTQYIGADGRVMNYRINASGISNLDRLKQPPQLNLKSPLNNLQAGQSPQLAQAAQAISIGNKDLGAKLDILTAAFKQGLNRPNIYAGSPEGVQAGVKAFNDLAKDQLRSQGY